MRVFISHSSQNAKTAEEVCTLIEKNGCRCFLAPRDIRSGHEYAEELLNGIDSSDVMLLLLSQRSNDSPHVLREVERAVSRKMPIIVYKMEEVKLSRSMEYFLMTHQWVSSKSGRDYSEIIACTNELKSKFGSDSAADVSLSQPDKTEVKGGFPMALKIVIPAAAAAVVAVVCLFAFGFFGGSEISAVGNSASAGGSSAVESSGIVESSDNSSNAGESSSIPETSTIPENSEEADNSGASETSSDESEAATQPMAQLGDRITFGSYSGKPIEWRVIRLSEDGGSAVVISEKILTMKAFDTAEGGKYNFLDGDYYWNVPAEDLTEEQEIKLRGSNNWELSNIRTWLNSDRENVAYADQPPIQSAMSELKNGYHTESGFLNGFTDEELAAVLTTEVKTGDTVTSDRVFLLSEEELQWLAEADVKKHAVPTEEAAAADGSGWYQLNVSEFSITDHYWWLRDPAESASRVSAVNISYSPMEIFSACAGLEGYGVRPAMTVDLSKLPAAD